MYGSISQSGLTSEQIQIINQYLEPKTQEVLKKIFSSNDLMYADLEKLINFEIPYASSAAGSATTGGIALLAGSPGFAIIAGACVVLTSAIAIGGGAYYGYILYQSHESYVKAVIDEGRQAASTIWNLYIKDNFQDQRTVDEIIFDRNHEAINSWFQLRNLGFLSIQEQESEDSKERRERYINKIKQYIKPEYLKSIHRNSEEIVESQNITQYDIETSRFSKKMRIYCAANKVGEFSHSKPKWRSPEWKKREELKNNIFSQCCIDGKKDIKTFEKIRDKFYRTYRAITYLNAVESNNMFSDENKKQAIILKSKQLAIELDSFIKERIEPSKRKEFEVLFRRYRCLGGACEFNPDNIFEMQFFDQYYSSDIFHFQDNAVSTALTVGMSFVTGMFPVPALNLVGACALTKTPTEERQSDQWWQERRKLEAQNPRLLK